MWRHALEIDAWRSRLQMRVLRSCNRHPIDSTLTIDRLHREMCPESYLLEQVHSMAYWDTPHWIGPGSHAGPTTTESLSDFDASSWYTRNMRYRYDVSVSLNIPIGFDSVGNLPAWSTLQLRICLPRTKSKYWVSDVFDLVLIRCLF